MLVEWLERPENKWEDAQPTGDGRGGSRGLSCVRGEQRRKDKTDGRGGNQARRTFLTAFMGVCSRAERQKMNFSNPEKLQESCRLGRAAKGMFCSCAVHVAAAWQITTLFPDPQHPLLKIHFQSLLEVSAIGTDRANNFICAREKWCLHMFCEAAWEGWWITLLIYFYLGCIFQWKLSSFETVSSC